MHFCGNPFHDFPLYLALGLPFLKPVFQWVRGKYHQVRNSRETPEGSA